MKKINYLILIVILIMSAGVFNCANTEEDDDDKVSDLEESIKDIKEPVAYGVVASNGAIEGGSGNFMVNRETTGVYRITIFGHTVTYQDYTASVNILNTATPGYATWTTSLSAYTTEYSSFLYVLTYNPAGTAAVNNVFSFVVWKN